MWDGVGPDAFSRLNGWQPPVRRSGIEEFTRRDAAILLDGDGSGHGHHRCGSNKGHNEFPEGWGEQDVVDWVNAIIDTPTKGSWDADHNDKFTLHGTYRGVHGALVIRNFGRWDGQPPLARMVTGYPTCTTVWQAFAVAA